MSLSRLDIGLEETARALAARDSSHWAGLVDRVITECHPDQRAFALDPGRRIVALVGRGGGKTTGGKMRLIKALLTIPKARCVYIATTRAQAEDLMWRPLKDKFAELGFVAGVDVIYNETKLLITLPRTDARLWLRGADKPHDTDKLRGLPFHEVGIDEAASYSDALLDNLITRVIGPRLGDYNGCIWVIGTPGHILKGLFYDISRPGSTKSRPWSKRDEYPRWKGWSFHEWSIESAIEKTRDRPIQALLNLRAEQLVEKAEQGWSDDNPIWMREYLGRWAADNTINVFRYRIYNDEGALWNQWDPERVGPSRIATLPDTFQDWAHVVAMDLGHSDPTAINVFSWSPSDSSRTIYHRLGFEQTKMYSQLIAHKLIGEELNHDKPGGVVGAIGEWPNGIVADSAHQMGAAILAELANVYGIRIEPAAKGYKYKHGAIEVVNGDLVDGRIKVLKGSELESQLMELQWVENRMGELQERKDQPNHSTDTLIYARALISTLITAGSVAPQESSRSRFDEPAIPEHRGENDYSHMFQDDYEALLG